MKEDKRKYNGGARANAGAKKIDPQEKKVSVVFQIKSKHAVAAKVKLQVLIDKINLK